MLHNRHIQDDKTNLIDDSSECSCDVTGHSIQVTRFRVANLCCGGEEKIIRTILDGKEGVESLAVNIMGRYIVVKHCKKPCCVTSTDIVTLLNKKILGASIQEANANEDGEDIDSSPDYPRFFHVGAVNIVFLLSYLFKWFDWIDNVRAFYLLATAIGAIPLLYESYVAIVRLTVDIHVLMLVAILGSLLLEEYFDACLVVDLFLCAELMESEVTRHVRLALRVISRGGMYKTVTLNTGQVIKTEDLKAGDIVVIRAGDMICCDGVVTNGTAIVDESAMTGEPLPITKVLGDKIMSGSVIQNGFIEVEANSEIANSTYRLLNQTVKDVQCEKGVYVTVVNQFAEIWTPFVLCTSFIVGVGGGT